MFATVDRLFTAADVTFTLGNLEFASEDVVEAVVAILPPSRRCERILFDDLFDDGLNGRRRHHDRLWCDLFDNAWRAGRRVGDDTTGSTGEELGFAASNLGLANGNVTLARDELLGALGSQHSPRAGVVWVDRVAAGAGALVREREHDGENGEYEREYEKKGRGRDRSMAVAGGALGATGRMPAVVAVTVTV